MNTANYNQTCRLNGEKMASVMLSCCAASPNDDTLELLSSTSESKPLNGTSTALDAMTIIGRIDSPRRMSSGQKQSSSAAGGEGMSCGGSSSRRGSNLWSEKMAKETSSGSATPNFPSIGASELIGMVPCGASDYTQRKNGNGRRSNKPFASNPLIDRGDSLVHQSSLLSLIASETMESVTISTPKNNGGEEAASSSSYTATTAEETKSYNTPTSTKNASTTPRMHNQQQQLDYRTPPRRISSLEPPPLPPDSPAMELSKAKQFANTAQMSGGNFRKNNREMLRNHRTLDSSVSPTSPSKKVRGGSSVGSASAPTTPSSAAARTPTSARTPPQRGRSLADENASVATSVGTKDDKRSVRKNINICSNNSIERVMEPYLHFQNAPLPPVWGSTANLNPELISTYQYPRLYLRDPTQIITEYTGDMNKNQTNDSLWWFHLAQRMQTTLKHVQDDHWKALILEKQSRCNASSHFSSSDSISAASSSVQQHTAFGCAGLEDGSSADGCVAMRDLCLGQQNQQQQMTGKSHRRNKSLSSHGSRHKLRKGPSSAAVNSTSPAFQSAACLVSAWSEPSASTIKIRGETYAKDGIKVESEPSMFSVLGVDSFVNNGKSSDEDASWGTKSYLQRWKRACEEVGLDRPPFLLIFNFIVPWGNFQVYMARSDADEGPFSSRHRNRPSEKAWRSFLEGTTEYRNKRLKLIPRVCAGPWMVKKMVGSTPALIGTKLPLHYRGSTLENYLEIGFDVTKGPAFGNSVANTVVGKADVVTVDLGFVIEGQENKHLPERMLGLVRLHHLDMKNAPTHSQWKLEVLRS